MRGIKIDPILSGVVLMLSVIGVIMVFSSSSILALQEYGDMGYFFKKQVLFYVFGIVVALIIARIPYQNVRGFILWINLLQIVLLIMVMIPYFNVEVNGAARWLSIAGFTFQPSELAKVTVIITLAHMIDLRIARKTWNTTKGILPVVGYLVMYAAFILLERHLSATMILLMVAGTIMMAGQLSKRYLFIFGSFASLLAIAAIIAEPFRLKRIFGFLNPNDDPLGDGYHIVQSWYALGSGEWFGLGLGMSRQKFGWLPENHTDFILAIIGEEMGFITVLFLIFLYFIFIVRGLYIALNAADRFGSLMTVGLVSLIGFQVVINISVVSGLFPVTGMPLPFISYGGSSGIILFMCIGLILAVGAQKKSDENENI